MFKRIIDKFVFNSSVRSFWIVVVLLNAVFGLFFGLSSVSSFSGGLGIICGVLTFMLLYIWADNKLRYAQRIQLSRQIRISAILKALLQLWPAADLLIGMIAMGVSQFVFTYISEVFPVLQFIDTTQKYHGGAAPIIGFLPFYTATIIHASFASLMVGVFVFIANIPRLSKRVY